MPTPANLIVFLSDNHNRNWMGSAGHPMVKTPAMDRLAETGTRFSDAYCTSPLCCPSRASFATGRFPHQTGYWDNALAYDGRVPTWHHRIRDAGHEVAAIGKLHYRSEKDDNGFSEEISTMHIVEGKGAIVTLLRASQDGVPRRKSHRAIYADSTVGEADYQDYDRQIATDAIDWLNARADSEKPWVLLVSFPSPHPPFKVPQRFWDMYPLEDVTLPVQWRPGERPSHPAVEYLAWMNNLQDGFSEEFVRKVIAGYCGLISHTDEQMARVLDAVDELDLTGRTRFVYTSDHGEAAGNHGILGKANHYEHGIGVPLIMSGPDIPAGKVTSRIASHVDLFPTFCEAMNVELEATDGDLPGASLWPALTGDEDGGEMFAEYHAMGSRNSGFALRRGSFKLIYHVDMPNQLFNLSADPLEEYDLLADGATHPMAEELEAALRLRVDPEAIDAKSKADQRAHMETFGGPEAARAAGVFSVTPAPGKKPDLELV